MAAMCLCQIDNLEIEIDGPEVPIMDGSAQPFVSTLLKIGTRPRPFEPLDTHWKMPHKLSQARQRFGQC
jgi:UDP-3-O-acyl-N-acetylglucosamine deacetylase